MKRSIKEIIGYTISAEDGLNGNVKDFLFDEDSWVIRYLDADLGLVFPGKRVLIPRTFLKKSDWVKRNFLINLEKSEIEKCPLIKDDLPVSREYEEALLKHYKTEDYWSRSYYSPIAPPAITHEGTPWNGPDKVKVPSKMFKEKDLETSLRSFTEIMGYQIAALDGVIGEIDDVIIEEDNWRICYVVVKMGNWFSSKKVLIGTILMDEISYVDKTIKINLTIQRVKSAPKFKSYHVINKEYEEELSNYYSKSKILSE